jgi:pimeloyl-ACP methyl ester carboxylesterase
MQALLDRLRRQPLIAIIGGALIFTLLGVVVIAASEGDSPSVGGSTTASTTSAAAPSSSTTGQAPTTTGAPTTAAPTSAAPAVTAAIAGIATTTTAAPSAGSATGTRCEVRLHGKGGSGSATSTSGNITIVQPTGNASGWGGRQWLYFPENRYVEARKIVADAVAKEGCEKVVLNGFSNGGAFAAKLYCRGENFDGRLVGVMIDDPVTDNAVTGCGPAPGVQRVLYWTGALQGDAQPGWQCSRGDWTCEGGTTLGIQAYSAALGTPATASPTTKHERNTRAPEPARWLG